MQIFCRLVWISWWAMKENDRLEPLQRHSLMILFSTGLLFWMSIAILLPTLPAYIHKIGIGQEHLGWIMGSFAIGLLATRPIVGKLADTRGRKFVLIIGTIVAAIAPLGYLTVTSVPLLMLMRAFHGISIAAFTTAYSALVVDVAPIAKRGEIIGYMSLANPVGVALGPAIGGYLQVAGLYSTIFWISISFGAIACLGANQLSSSTATFTELDIGGNANRPTASTSIWKILTNPALSVPAGVLLLIGFPFGALHTFIPLYIQDSNINLNPGLFYTMAALASFSARTVIGGRSDRYGRGIFIAGSLCCYTAGMFCLANGGSRISFIAGAILEGLGTGTLIPMVIALVSDRSLPEHRGQVLSTCTAGLDLGIAIASPLFGAVITRMGYHGVFSIGTGLAGLAIVLFIGWGNQTVRQSIGFCLGRSKDSYRLS
jgi:MFS family permease